MSRRTPPPDHPMGALHLPLPETATLSNGVSVWLLPDKRAPVVEFRLVLPTGGRAFDDPEWLGVAGATARLMTAGTPRRTSLQIADEAERYGGSLGFAANTETATMYAHCLAAFTEPMLELIADVLLNPAFPDNEIEIDRANTLQRLALQRTQPDFLAEERFRQVLFGAHPYHYYAPNEEAVKRWNAEHLHRFYREHYCPQGATLIVVGDFSPKRLLKHLEEQLGAWQGALKQDKLPAPNTEPVETGFHLVPRPNSVQSVIHMGTLCPSRHSPDYWGLLVGVSVLGAGASSRLFLTVREQYGYAYSVGAHLDYYRRISAFVASAQTATENTFDAIRQIRAEIDRLLNEPVPPEELQAVRNYLIGRHMLSWVTLGSIANLFMQIAIHGLPMDYWHQYPEQVRTVSRESVQEACARYLRAERMSIVVVGEESLRRNLEATEDSDASEQEG